jgi:hypothetical protein
MLGRYIDIGNPIGDHPTNSGLLAFWPGITPYLSQWGWQNAASGGRYRLTAGGSVADPRIGGGVTGEMVAVAGTAGAGGWWSAASADALVPANTYSWEIVFRHTTASTFQALLNAGYGNMLVRVNTSNQLNVLQSQIADLGSTTQTLTLGAWHHILITINGSNNWNLYLNGAPVLSGTEGFSAFTTFYLGSEYGSYNAHQGWIGGAAVWGRPLSAADVSARANEWRMGCPNILRRYSMREYLPESGGGGGGNRRRRALICGGPR